MRRKTTPAVKPGLDWRLDWTMDWTVDWTLDWTAWDHQELLYYAPPAQSSGIRIIKDRK